MRQHRRTAKTVPNIPSPDNSATADDSSDSDPFDPAAALETLHTEIIQLEAFAHAAGEAVTRLCHSSDPKHRRDLTRIYALVSKVATDAAAAAHHGDHLISHICPDGDPRWDLSQARPWRVTSVGSIATCTPTHPSSTADERFIAS